MRLSGRVIRQSPCGQTCGRGGGSLTEQELRDLRMERARFEVKIAWQAGASGAPVSEAFGQDAKKRYLFDHS